mgnify:CR=1 FL=1
METMEFNLLQERWVRVRTQDCTVQEVSLTDALLHAHAYVDLAGEMPTQDAAMLRLQLAVLHTVFSRVDGNGVPAPFEEPRDALQRWANCGSWGTSRNSRSGITWTNGRTVSGCSTRSAPSGRCRKRKSVRNTRPPN